MIGRMRMDLSEQQWDAVVEGQLIAPDGTRYVRRTTKTKRRTCESLLGEGAPLVSFYWAGGQLDWFDGEDESSQWQAVRRAVTSEEPRPRGDVQWNAGVWEGDDGRSLVLLTGYC